MVHVPPTLLAAKAPGRRGRPPKHRDPLAPIEGCIVDEEIPNAPKPTFITSLSFKVKGSQPISEPPPLPEEALPASQKFHEVSVPPSSPAATMSGPTQSPSYDSAVRGRAPRKSKMDAMVALSARSVSPTDAVRRSPAGHPSGSASTSSGPRVNGTSHSKPKSQIPPPPDLPSVDFEYIKMPQRIVDPPRPVPRPFEIEDCPAFYPTAEEFKDPMEYVKSISDQARPYGICKVVPPKGWNMPCVIDTKSFRFKTRLQRLNSIEASSRAKLNFLEQLYRFHQQQDQVGPVVPTINHKPLDLWLLRKEVHNKGGYEAASRARLWGEIARQLGYDGLLGVSTQLKNAYQRIILPFEQFSDHIRNSPAMNSLSPASFRFYGPPGRMGAQLAPASRMSRLRAYPPVDQSATASVDRSRLSTPASVGSSSLSEVSEDVHGKAVQDGIKIEVIPSLSASCVADSSKTSKELPSTPLPQVRSGVREKPAHYVQGDTCEVCDSGERGTQMLLCDGCDRGYHTFCLDPPLTTIPKGQWYCHICLFDTGGDYGFDEGEDHSLHSFQERDLAFRKAWFESHPPPPPAWDGPRSTKLGSVNVTEDDVEREFWRLVESPLETVEIEYGADVHSTTHGSASPSLETHPLDPYSRDGWNVNNMPIVSDSLLRYVKSDISGMTVPWIYVGMVFSTFCWHNEDHYTYSVNYMHWGETKTWYGIPGDDAEKFEAAIKSEAPDLFDAQPDLLFQLVTLMSPKRLKEAGVRVYGCNQRPGEYVITFPKAYHAGFNHGLNLNEAVNFATPDWLDYGRACVRRYQDHQKLPVFSHEELLITITQHSQTIKTAAWVIDALTEMVKQQFDLREALRRRVPNILEIVDEHDRPEEQYQCAVCKGFSYLAQVTCECTKQVACLEHWEDLCACVPSSRVLRKRFDDTELSDIVNDVAEKAQQPELWARRVKAYALEAKPDLAKAEALLREADEMAVPIDCYPSLRKFWEAGTAMVRKAKKILEPRPILSFPRVIPLQNPRYTFPHPSEYEGVFQLEEIQALLEQASKISFEAPVLHELRGALEWANNWKRKADNTRANFESRGIMTTDLINIDATMAEGFNHNIFLGSMRSMVKFVRKCHLLEELKDLEKVALTLEDVQALKENADACGLEEAHRLAISLSKRLLAGMDWQSKAKKILDSKHKSIEELNSLACPPFGTPVIPQLLERIDAVRAQARETEKKAQSVLHPPLGRQVDLHDVAALVDQAKQQFSIPAVDTLGELCRAAITYEKSCSDVISSRYAPHKPLFEELREIRADVQRRLWIFRMPYFERVDQQLVKHDAWLEKLPWYRTPEPAMQGKLIVDDVINYTRPEDDAPPKDPDCTCICTDPVIVPLDRSSDAVQCDHCGAKFHAKCIEGSCPFCDHHHWNGAIVKSRRFEYPELFPIALEAPDLTRNYSLAWKHLEIIITMVDRLIRVLEALLAVVPGPKSDKDPAPFLAQIRHFMRKLYRLQFVIKTRPEMQGFGYVLCHLHRRLAVSRTQANGGGGDIPKKKPNRRPKFVFTVEQLPPASDGTLCVCSGSQTGHSTITCLTCTHSYHRDCVYFEDDHLSENKTWRCPLCAVKKGKPYPHCAVRVVKTGEKKDGYYIDTKACLEKYSNKVIRHSLPPPGNKTIMLIMSRFFPGSSSSTDASGLSSNAPNEPSPRQPKPPSASHYPPSQLTGNSKPSEPVPAMHRHPPKLPAAPVPILPAAAIGEKRKAAGSPVVENQARRIKLVFRDGDKAEP